MDPTLKKTDWDAVLQEFIGKDKVESVDIFINKKGNWVYKYKERENGKLKYHTIECPDRHTADQFHFTFGGKNPTSVSAPPEFNKLGAWRSEDIFDTGHRITELKVTGMREIRNSTIPIEMPDNSGYEYLAYKKKKRLNGSVNFILRDNEKCQFTRVFTSCKELDNFINFIQTQPMLCKLTWYIDKIVMENEETNQVGFWKRCLAKDGTSRMILELKKIDGKSYTEFMFKEILGYADGMADGECRKVPSQKKKIQEDTVCYFAAKNGQVVE